jgi:hypothetical protein
MANIKIYLGKRMGVSHQISKFADNDKEKVTDTTFALALGRDF